MEVLIDIVLQALRIIGTAAPVWAPLLLFGLFWRTWINYSQLKNISKREFTLVEILLPKDVTRSPLAMEAMFNVLHDRGTGPTMYQRFVRGHIFPWFSLEIASIEGEIHFYIWLDKNYQHIFEAQIYAHFPDVEIVEVQDYTQQIEFDEKTHTIWAQEWTFNRSDVYPIKTYVDYGMDKDPKEEQKIDPLVNMLEFMGSLGKGEQLWTQFVVRYHHNQQRRKKGTLNTKVDPWIEEAEEEIEKIKKEATIIKDDENGTPQLVLTPGQRETIEAIERSTGKLPFDVGMRSIYIANQDDFRKANIAGLVGSVRQYTSYGFNGFRPAYSTEPTDPWEGFFGSIFPRRRRMLFDAYRRRSFFYPPYRKKFLVLTSEELATIFHFPGRVSTTPTLKRIESRKAGPPGDLPV